MKPREQLGNLDIELLAEGLGGLVEGDRFSAGVTGNNGMGVHLGGAG
uniref:Uncharacterized protein n=1 Tax=Desertifilum tharense IPPAS B-1220 TaxID=1781255 RepID=A0ACD5GTJ5_9CYAN